VSSGRYHRTTGRPAHNREAHYARRVQVSQAIGLVGSVVTVLLGCYSSSLKSDKRAQKVRQAHNPSSRMHE
jgi:hypothetical protein